MNLLAIQEVRSEMRLAWKDSEAAIPHLRHEEGGFIVEDDDGNIAVHRWRRGSAYRINPPQLDANNRYNGLRVLAVFHTHPHPPIDEEGQEWEQAPGASDIRWHRRMKLPGFVISAALVYEINTKAKVSVVGKREEVLRT